MLEKAELTLIIMLSKTKKVITTHLIVLCSVASHKLFYSIAWRVGTLSLQFVPPAEGGGMEIIMSDVLDFRYAERKDAGLILKFIKDLAKYEKM